MVVKVKIKKGDKVIVVAGKDKNKTGEVLKVYPKDLKILVEGINVVKRHQKPSASSSGGIVDKQLPIHISNIAYLDPKEQKPTKIGYKVENGKKVRYAKLSDSIIDN